MIASALIAAGIGAAGAAYAANKSSKAIKNAAAVSADAAREANDLQREIYGKNEAALNPAITSGNQARTQLGALLGLGGDTDAANSAFQNYLKSTGYKFTTDQGVNAINSSRATRGLLNSGSTVKALDQFGQGNASQYFGNYADRLGSLASGGVSAAGALAGVGANYAGAVGNNLQTAANTTANAGLAGANMTNGLVTQGIGALGQYLGSQQSQSSYAPPAAQPYDPLRQAGAWTN